MEEAEREEQKGKAESRRDERVLVLLKTAAAVLLTCLIAAYIFQGVIAAVSGTL